MTKKHFIALADMIKDNKETFSHHAINRLSEFCAIQNPIFKEGTINRRD